MDLNLVLIPAYKLSAPYDKSEEPLGSHIQIGSVLRNSYNICRWVHGHGPDLEIQFKFPFILSLTLLEGQPREAHHFIINLQEYVSGYRWGQGQVGNFIPFISMRDLGHGSGWIEREEDDPTTDKNYVP